MRIRNRKVILPLSSLPPVPLSDPHFSHLIQPNDCIADGPSRRHPLKPPQDKFVCDEGRDQYDNPNGGEEEGIKIGDDNRDKTMLGAKTVTHSLHQGENATPLKKRKETETKTGINHKKTKSDRSKSGAKKRVRGGAVMEGSRCSRVNGRGWRCCQPTLVGYSLCEHHLGKSRLRSMASVPSQIPVIEKQELSVSKKKRKLGMVKARSMSSLLGQPNNAALSTAENEE